MWIASWIRPGAGQSERLEVGEDGVDGEEVQPVADVDGQAEAVFLVHGGQAAPVGGLVGDVVVDEEAVVEQLQRGGCPYGVLGTSAEGGAGGDGQCGPQTLALAGGVGAHEVVQLRAPRLTVRQQPFDLLVGAGPAPAHGLQQVRVTDGVLQRPTGAGTAVPQRPRRPYGGVADQRRGFRRVLGGAPGEEIHRRPVGRLCCRHQGGGCRTAPQVRGPFPVDAPQFLHAAQSRRALGQQREGAPHREGVLLGAADVQAVGQDLIDGRALEIEQQRKRPMAGGAPRTASVSMRALVSPRRLRERLLSGAPPAGPRSPPSRRCTGPARRRPGPGRRACRSGPPPGGRGCSGGARP
ncbi:hypothetical protein SGLAM104S_03733 [Streptomyces glaucescens]